MSFLKEWEKLAGKKDSFSQVGFPDATPSIYESIIDEMLYYVDGVEKDSHILEVGCGNGLLLSILEQRGFSNLSGCDYSRSLVLNASERLIDKVDLKCIEAAAISESYQNKRFDLIYVHSVCQYFESYEYFENFYISCLRLLKEDGSLFLGDLFNENYFSKTQRGGLRKWLRSAFGNEKAELKNFILPINKLFRLDEISGNRKIYPLLEWKNAKGQVFKEQRFNLLVSDV